FLDQVDFDADSRVRTDTAFTRIAELEYPLFAGEQKYIRVTSVQTGGPTSYFGDITTKARELRNDGITEVGGYAHWGYDKPKFAVLDANGKRTDPGPAGDGPFIQEENKTSILQQKYRMSNVVNGQYDTRGNPLFDIVLCLDVLAETTYGKADP